MTTMTPPIVSIPTELASSSPEIIVAWLNEQTVLNSSEPKHCRAKRQYPFWRVCPGCKKPYAVLNCEQIYKKLTCSQSCANKVISEKKRGKTKRLEDRAGKTATCGHCGTEVWKPNAWAKRNKQTFCSRRCRAVKVAQNRDMASIGKLGSKGWTTEGRQRMIESVSGPKNPAWKGGVTYFRKHGNYPPIKYIRCPAEYLPMARKDGYVMEHRLLVAQAIGRCLLRSEVVHHINHDATDNRIENLELFASNQDHKRYEHHGLPKPLWPK